MKAIIINTVVKEGSIGKIAYGLYNHLKSCGHECMVCYGRGEIYPDEPDLIRLDTPFEVYCHIVLTRLVGLHGFCSGRATRKLVSIMDEYKPDVVYLLNLHGYYLHEFKTLLAIKRRNIKTVYVMMDEYPFLGKCCYHFDCTRYQTGCGKCPYVRGYPKSIFIDFSHLIWKKKEKCYSGFDNIIFACVPYTLTKASKSTLLHGKKFTTIDTGVSLDFYKPRDVKNLRDKHNINEDKVVALCVATYSDIRKGSKYFLEAAQMPECRDIIFIHVGFDVSDIPIPSNYIPVPYVRDQDELAAYYSLADILVCPSLADAMPNVCLEALGCGTPVAGFNCGGTPYTATPEFGTFVEKGDVKALSEVLVNTPKKTNERIKACREYALSRFSNKLYFSKLESFAYDL